MKSMTLLTLLFTTTALSLSGDPTSAQDRKLFYRGDLDDQKVEAPNGAIVNADYLNFLVSGGWDEAKLVEVREGVHTIVGYSLSNYTFIEGETGLIVFDVGNNIGMGRPPLGNPLLVRIQFLMGLAVRPNRRT